MMEGWKGGRVTQRNDTGRGKVPMARRSHQLPTHRMMSYEGLRAWRDCHALALAVYKTTAEFPHHELYGLISQARRAAVSAAANIAEGSATRGPRDYCRFLNIALRSLSELSYLLLLERTSSTSP